MRRPCRPTLHFPSSLCKLAATEGHWKGAKKEDCIKYFWASLRFSRQISVTWGWLIMSGTATTQAHHRLPGLLFCRVNCDCVFIHCHMFPRDESDMPPNVAPEHPDASIENTCLIPISCGLNSLITGYEPWPWLCKQNISFATFQKWCKMMLSWKIASKCTSWSLLGNFVVCFVSIFCHSL